MKTPRFLTSGNSAYFTTGDMTASSVRPEARSISCHTGLPLSPPNVSFSYSSSPSGVTASCPVRVDILMLRGKVRPGHKARVAPAAQVRCGR